MMYCYSLLLVCCAVSATWAWSVPFYPVRGPTRLRYTRYAPAPPQAHPQTPHETPTQREPKERWQRAKRQHDYDSPRGSSAGVTGPVHTFVKTDKNANYKWGVRHHVGNKYAS